MKNQDLQYRFYIFAGILLLGVPFYQSYFNYHIHKSIDESLSANNKITSRHVEARTQLTQARNYWANQYYASEHINKQLEKQLDVINKYWHKELSDLQDRFFDLKHGAKESKQNEK